MSLTTAAPEKNRGPSVSSPEPLNPTAGHVANLPERPTQSTIFDLPGVTGATLARGACDAHDADPSEAKAWFISASIDALMTELPSGPCSLATARHRHGIKAPPDVDGRACGASSRRLCREGRIELAGWFEPSPWEHCHVGSTRVWRLPTKGRP